MSEKQFEFYSDEDLIGVLDTVTGRTFNSFEIVDKLNEQQSTIESLKKDYIILKIEDDLRMSEKRFSKTEKKCYYTSLVLDNKTQDKLGTTRVVDLLNEQQVIISSLKKENEQLHYQIIDLQDKLCMSEKVINDE